jgi:hypothetical protein
MTGQPVLARSLSGRVEGSLLGKDTYGSAERYPVLISGDNSNIQGSVICSWPTSRREKVLGDPRRPARSRMTPQPLERRAQNLLEKLPAEKTVRCHRGPL